MRRLHFILAVFAAALYAGCYVAIKVGLAYAPPVQFAAWRAALGGTVLLVMLLALRRPVLPSRRLWGPTTLLAVTGPVVGFLAMFMSPRHTAAGLASVLGNTGPLLIIGFAAVFFREPLSRGKIGALALGVLGVGAIAISSTTSFWSASVITIALPLLASTSGAAESLIVKWARPKSDALSVAAWQYLLAAAVLFILAALFEPDSSIAWTRSFLVILLGLAGGTTAAATGLWYWLVQREEVSRLSLVLFLVPVGGLAAGIAVFGEAISAGQAAGVSLILAGVAIAGVNSARSTRPESMRRAT